MFFYYREYRELANGDSIFIDLLHLERMSLNTSAAIVVPDSGEGGIYTFYAEFVGHWFHYSLDVTVENSDPFSGKRVRYADFVRTLPPSLSRYLAVARDAYARALAGDSDILEVCDWPLGFVPAVLEQRLPYVVQCHGSMGQIAEHDPQAGADLEATLVQLIEPALLRYAHRMQTYSLANKRFWEGLTGRPVKMIRPAFALPPLPTETAAEPVGRVFGRLQRWKGPHILCEALRRLGGGAPEIQWYGSVKPWASGEWPADRRLAADFPDVWGSRFLHRPAVPREQVFALQASAMFSVVPSTWDVFNFTAVESMAAARPTIVSTGAGASELIVDGENGFTFENADAGALAGVIDRVLALPEARRREIGAAGRETIRIELDPARIAEQRLAAYQEAIRSFRESPPPIPHDWLVRLLTPASAGDENFDVLLDPVPLRAMAEHMSRRLARKLKPRAL